MNISHTPDGAEGLASLCLQEGRRSLPKPAFSRLGCKVGWKEPQEGFNPASPSCDDSLVGKDLVHKSKHWWL